MQKRITIINAFINAFSYTINALFETNENQKISELISQITKMNLSQNCERFLVMKKEK